MDLDAIIPLQKHTIDGLRAESATPGQMGYGKDGAE